MVEFLRSELTWGDDNPSEIGDFVFPRAYDSSLNISWISFQWMLIDGDCDLEM